MTTTQHVDSTVRRRLPGRSGIDWVSRYAAGTTLVLVLCIAAAVAPSFFSTGNLRTVALQSAALGLVVLGQTLALLVRGLDMSVSAVIAFSGVLVVSANGPGMAIWLLLLAAAVAAVVGLANGLLVTWRGVPPFVATFAMLIVVGGCRLAYTHGQTSGSAPGWLRRLGTGSLLGLPMPVVIWLVMLAIFWLALARTRWGRWIYAAGANPEAARHSGVPVGAVTVSAYVVCAFCAMIAGLVLSGYLGYVDANLGVNANLNSITAAIVGGVAFSGGRGGVLGATVGAILLTVLLNVVVVAGLPVYWQTIAMGVVLVLAVAIQAIQRPEDQQQPHDIRRSARGSGRRSATGQGTGALRRLHLPQRGLRTRHPGRGQGQHRCRGHGHHRRGTAPPSGPAAADAPIVAPSGTAGCQVIGKTNMHEYAFGVTNDNVHHGVARNPVDAGACPVGPPGAPQWRSAWGCVTGRSARTPVAPSGFRPASAASWG